MFSIADFEKKYKAYSDEELLEMHISISNYNDDAQKAFENIVKTKGGIEALLKRREDKLILLKEEKRIAGETEKFGKEGIDADFIKTITKSTILSEEKVQSIIDQKFLEVEAEIDDKKIKPRTIIGGVIGGLIAIVVGGTLWGLQLIYSQRIFYVFGVGLALLCYSIIKLITKQSKKNTFVIVASVISFILAVLLGQLLYNIVGFRE